MGVKCGYLSIMVARQLMWDAEDNTGTSGTERNCNPKKKRQVEELQRF